MTRGAEGAVKRCVFVPGLAHFKHSGDGTSQHLTDPEREKPFGARCASMYT